jgi:hypothetical protein
MLLGGAPLAEQNKARKSNDSGTASQPDLERSPGFPIVSIVLRIVFSIVPHCSCASGFSLASSRPCIVFGVNFPL